MLIVIVDVHAVDGGAEACREATIANAAASLREPGVITNTLPTNEG